MYCDPGSVGAEMLTPFLKTQIERHTLQLCGITSALGDRSPGALVNAVQPLVIYI